MLIRVSVLRSAPGDGDSALLKGVRVVRVQDVIDAVLRRYPPALAEDWDTGIGLTCGDPDAVSYGVLVAVDADEATVDEAIRLDADLLLTHHPLLFRPVQSVAEHTPKGALISRLILAGVAHFAAHTNADAGAGGVNDALAEALGLSQLRPLVRSADGAATGSGRVGRLPAPMTLRDFAAHVAARLPPTVGGVRAAGDPDRRVSSVAVCGGAGDSLLPAAAESGADVYVTSDLRHHVVAEFVADPTRPAVVDVAHWAGEWPWLAAVAAGLAADFPELAVTVSALRTDPWTVHAPSAVDG